MTEIPDSIVDRDLKPDNVIAFDIVDLVPAWAADDPVSIEILIRAHGIARTRVTADGANDAPTPIDDLDDVTVVSIAFALLLGKLTAAGAHAPVTHRCGWCHAAAGGTDVAWAALPPIATADIKAHTLTCEHNPLVVRVAELEAALAEACNHLHSAIQRNRYSCHMCAMDRRDALHESDRVAAHRALIAKGVVLP